MTLGRAGLVLSILGWVLFLSGLTSAAAIALGVPSLLGSPGTSRYAPPEEVQMPWVWVFMIASGVLAPVAVGVNTLAVLLDEKKRTAVIGLMLGANLAAGMCIILVFLMHLARQAP